MAELTMQRSVVLPHGGSLVLPSYPWPPSVVEDLYEEERKAYLHHLRDVQERVLKGK